MSDLELFELGVHLAKALGGNKEAIADIKKLYDKHPEMFQNMQEVIDTINEVIKEPEIVTSAKRNGAILAAKRLENNHKMGEIAIENDNGTNIVFHTNKKKLSEFNKLKKQARLLVEAPSTEVAPTRSDRCANKSNDLSMCDKALSTTDENIIPQKTTKETKTEFKQGQIKAMQEAVKRASQKLKDNIKSIDMDY